MSLEKYGLQALDISNSEQFNDELVSLIKKHFGDLSEESVGSGTYRFEEVAKKVIRLRDREYGGYRLHGAFEAEVAELIIKASHNDLRLDISDNGEPVIRFGAA